MLHLLEVWRRLFLAEALPKRESWWKTLEMFQNGRSEWMLYFILTIYKNMPATTFLLP
jgi:hypothetical protein